MLIIIVFLAFIMSTFLVFGIMCYVNGSRMHIQERLETYLQNTEDNYLPPVLEQPLRERVKGLLTPLLQIIPSKVIPRNKIENYRKKIKIAGNPAGLSAENFLAIKYSMVFAIAMAAILSRNLAIIIVLALSAYYLPDIWLKSKQDRRRQAIVKSLPDVLDLLSVSVEAGLCFYAALLKVVEKSSGPLTDEFEKALREIEMGKPRRDALRDMADRICVDDVTVFISSIIQAEQLGVALSNVLNIQAAQVRENRKMRAEEKAQKAPIKILLPLVLFIFPTILLVLLGPAAIRMMDTL